MKRYKKLKLKRDIPRSLERLKINEAQSNKTKLKEIEMKE